MLSRETLAVLKTLIPRLASGANSQAESALMNRYTRQGLHRLEKYLNLEGFLEKLMKMKSILKSTGKSLKPLKVFEFYRFL